MMCICIEYPARCQEQLFSLCQAASADIDIDVIQNVAVVTVDASPVLFNSSVP